MMQLYRPQDLGLVKLRLGDIVQVSGEWYIVEFVNDCRARVTPLAKKHIEYETKFGQRVSLDTQGRTVNIARHVDPSLMIERLGEAGYKEFLAFKKTSGRKSKVKEVINSEEENTMSKKSKKAKSDKPVKKPRGGLAADMAADRAAAETVTETPKPKRGRKPKADGAATPAVSYAGRSELIAKLVVDGMSDEDILAKVKESFPGSSPFNVNKTIKAKHAKAEKLAAAA